MKLIAASLVAFNELPVLFSRCLDRYQSNKSMIAGAAKRVTLIPKLIGNAQCSDSPTSSNSIREGDLNGGKLSSITEAIF